MSDLVRCTHLSLANPPTGSAVAHALPEGNTIADREVGEMPELSRAAHDGHYLSIASEEEDTAALAGRRSVCRLHAAPDANLRHRHSEAWLT